MFKTIFRLIVLIFMVGFITISPRESFIVGVSLKQISTFHLWTVKYEESEKCIIKNPNWIQTLMLKPSNK